MEMESVSFKILNEYKDSSFINLLSNLPELKGTVVRETSTIEEAFKLDLDILVINKKENKDCDYESLFLEDYVKEEVILLVDDADYYKIFNSLYKKGIIVLKRSISSDYLSEIIKLTLRSIYKKKNNIKKISELCKLDVAKSILISIDKKSEDQAHKYIEKSSMNFRVPLLKMADEIILNHLRGNDINEYKN